MILDLLNTTIPLFKKKDVIAFSLSLPSLCRHLLKRSWCSPLQSPPLPWSLTPLSPDRICPADGCVPKRGARSSSLSFPGSQDSGLPDFSSPVQGPFSSATAALEYWCSFILGHIILFGSSFLDQIKQAHGSSSHFWLMAPTGGWDQASPSELQIHVSSHVLIAPTLSTRSSMRLKMSKAELLISTLLCLKKWHYRQEAAPPGPLEVAGLSPGGTHPPTRALAEAESFHPLKVCFPFSLLSTVSVACQF